MLIGINLCQSVTGQLRAFPTFYFVCWQEESNSAALGYVNFPAIFQRNENCAAAELYGSMENIFEL